jgi:predicted phosphohydrolase
MHGVRFVMITGNPINGSVKFGQVCFDVLEVEGEVAEVIYLVARLHDSVPAIDELVVHLFDGIKWTLTVADYIFVPEVMVTGKPHLFCGLDGFIQEFDPS